MIFLETFIYVGFYNFFIMEISNKLLALFLFAAVVVSMAGTIMSLNKVGDVPITGYSTTQFGNMTLTVEEVISITTEDSPSISFGSCQPSAAGLIIINSEEGENTSTACPGFTANQIAIRNNGNVDVEVTVSPDDVGTAEVPPGTFLAPATGSYVDYLIVNEGYVGTGNSGGCTGDFPETYERFEDNSTEYEVCTQLTSSSGGNTANSVLMNIQIGLPNDVVPDDYSIEFTYTAGSVNP